MARKRRGSVRTGTKRVTEQIRENAEHLAEHPEHAVPRCQGSCPLLCKFRRSRIAIRRRHDMIDDDDKLERWSRWGNELGRAYAAVLRIADSPEGSLEYFQNVNTHEGKVPVAPWGQAPALIHVGLQHRHDRGLRLLSAIPLVRSGDAVYATEEGLVCSHDGSVPDEAEDLLLEDLPVERTSETLATCEHAPGQGGEAPHIEVGWKDAALELRVCERCISGNLIAQVQNHVVTKAIRDLVDVRVHLSPLVDPADDRAPDPDWSIPSSVMDAYVSAEIPDSELIEEARRARRYAVEAIDEPMIVVSNRVYRPPFDQVLDQLDAPEIERELLDVALEQIQRPIVLDEGTSMELLERLWPDYGDLALESVLGSSGLELYEPDADAEDLERLVEVVDERVARKRVDAALPSYEEIPSPVDLADRVARAHRRRGRQRAQQILSSAPDEEHRAVALALVRALGLPSTAWTVNPRTEDMAEGLVPYAERLIEADGDEYHEALQALLQATGSTAKLERTG